ncbi:hypothetical protein D3C75_663700 [compost metagenome]
MSQPVNESSKLQDLIEKFGGWAGIALVSLAAFMYQGDKANIQASVANAEKGIAANQRAISRLQEGKVSREEFKSVQEQWIRETQGLRQDIRELTGALRVDLNAPKPK